MWRPDYKGGLEVDLLVCLLRVVGGLSFIRHRVSFQEPDTETRHPTVPLVWYGGGQEPRTTFQPVQSVPLKTFSPTNTLRFYFTTGCGEYR